MDAVRMLERGLGIYAKANLVDKRTLDRNHRIDRKGAKDVFMFNFVWGLSSYVVVKIECEHPCVTAVGVKALGGLYFKEIDFRCLSGLRGDNFSLSWKSK
jgi:hypothetical protein